MYQNTLKDLVLNNGLDLTINDKVPQYDFATGGYKYHFMKSNAEITFDYETNTTEVLNTDWVISGPTNWAGSSMAKWY